MSQMIRSQIDYERPLNLCKASAGTGKTFTLAAYYIALLMSHVHYSNILAVTFTNKATAEMKERILCQLYAIAHDTADMHFINRVRSFLLPGCENISNEEMKQMAEKCFKQMIEDYDHMRICTIDSFLQTLLAGASQMLGMGNGLATELNIKSVITQAVDELLTTEMNEQVSRAVASYVADCMQDENKWDFRSDLIKMATFFYSEAAQAMQLDGQIELDQKKIADYKNAIDWRKRPELLTVKQLAENIPEIQPAAGTINGVNAIEKLKKTSLQALKGKEDFSPLSDSKCTEIKEKKRDKYQQLYGADVYDMIIRLDELVRELQPIVKLYKIVADRLNDMRLMNALQKQIELDLDAANRDLLARTAARLRTALDTGDADFILEKVGIRYTHILMDEFQDTSKLQWSVFRPLVEELLAAEEHTLLVVGDVKQSIYRWRNGDWHIMETLTDHHYSTIAHHHNPHFSALRRNFRSRCNIVKFNLTNMQKMVENEVSNLDAPSPQKTERAAQLRHIYNENFSEDKLPDFYLNNGKREGGMVQLRAYPYLTRKGKDDTPLAQLTSAQAKEHILLDMFADIERLLEAGQQASDIMILVRYNKEALQVVKRFQALIREEAGLPEKERRFTSLVNQKMVSSDSFHLESSTSVMLIVCGLRIIHKDDQVAQLYIQRTLTLFAQDAGITIDVQDAIEAIKKLDRRMPLFELVKQLMRICCFQDDKFLFNDAAYLNAFLDKIRDFVGNNGSDREAFLQAWDDDLHAASIAAPEDDGIRIMSVHTAKGLQSASLFIPFASWNMHDDKGFMWCNAPMPDNEEKDSPTLKKIPIKINKNLRETSLAADYDEEYYQMRIDNLNLLYVALTRAEDNLFVYIPQAVSYSKTEGIRIANNTVGGKLIDALAMGQLLIDQLLAYNDAEKHCFIEYRIGEPVIKMPQTDDKDKNFKIFRFDDAQVMDAELHFSDSAVRFRQSQESITYGRFSSAERAEDQLYQIQLGNICHDIFSRMRVATDAQAIISDFRARGIIESEQQEKQISQLINGAWQTQEMADWFDGSWQLLLEQPIFFKGHEIRPDRVMIKGKKAIVLDYKFGRDHEDIPQQYIDQVHRYMDAMNAIGYSDVDGYLWFAQKQQGERLVKIL